MACGGGSPDGLSEKIETKTFWLPELFGQLAIQIFPKV